MSLAQGLNCLILAAGKGTRLLPLTKIVPKPLFPILNEPAISLVLKSLKQFGISSIAVNCHHLADRIISWAEKLEKKNRPFLLREERLLNTGGGIKNAFDFFGYGLPLLVYNSDIVANINIKELYSAFLKNCSDALLVLHNCPRFNNVLCDGDNIIDFLQAPSPLGLAYTGVAIFNPILFKDISSNSPFPLISFLKNAISEGRNIHFIRGESITNFNEKWLWHDIGTPSGYLDANFELINRAGIKKIISTDCYVDNSATIEDNVIMGKGVKVGKGVHLKEVVIWEKSVIRDNESFKRAIITPYGNIFA